jgi:hypothetical protein
LFCLRCCCSYPSPTRVCKVAHATEPPHFYRAFCPGTVKDRDHHLFAKDGADEHCPICNEDTRYDCTGKPHREALFYELDDWCKRQLKLEELARWIYRVRDEVKRTRGRCDWAWDGSILAGGNSWLFEHMEEEEEVIVLAGCCDATVLSHGMKSNVTPFVFDNMCLPEWLRKAFDTKYVGAMLPDGMKPTQVTMLPLVEMLAKRQPGPRGEALRVEVAKHKEDSESRWLRVIVAWLVNDLKGYAGPMLAFQHPALKGLCHTCMVCGLKIPELNLTVVPGACSCLPPGAELRAHWADVYRKFPALVAMCKPTAPKDFTKAAAQKYGLACEARTAAARTVKDREEVEKDSWFRGVDIWSQHLAYWDRIKQNINDPAHELANVVTHIISMIGNLKRQELNAKRRNFAQQCEQVVAGDKVKWHCSTDIKTAMDKVVKQLKLPKGWPRARYFFHHLYRLGCAEALLFAGPLGVYMLEFADIDDDIKQAFIDLLWLCEKVQAKEHSSAEVDKLEFDLVEVLARLETLLPISWCTIVAHVALHLCEFIRRCGPFKEFNMLVFERFHVMVKKLIKGKRNQLASFHNHYMMLINSSEWRVLAERAKEEGNATRKWMAKGFQSTIAASKPVDYRDKIISTSGAQRDAQLSPADFNEVRDMWCSSDEEHSRYNWLRTAYRKKVQDPLAQLPHELPDNFSIRDMRDSDLPYLGMRPDIKLVEYANINKDMARFRNTDAQRFTRTDNSAIKGWYRELESPPDTPWTATYGWIKRMFLHAIYPGAEPLVVVECDWLDVLPDPSFGGLVRGLKVLDRPRGTGPPRFVFLKECTPYNIALLSESPFDKDCLTFNVIDRQGKLGAL